MVKSTYNGMFSISDVKSKFLNAAGEFVSHSFKHFETYDLANYNVYSMEGDLIVEADQVSINSDFLLRIIHTDTLNEVTNFLNYQFIKTPDKESFLDYTEFCIVPQLGEVKSTFVNRWINRQRNKQHDDVKKPTTFKDNASFESKLTEDQLKQIKNLVNEIKLFNETIDSATLKLLFKGKLSTPLCVKNNQNLAHLFNQLQPFFLTDKWQSVIEKNKCFKGVRGKFTTAKNLSASLNNVNTKSETSLKISKLIASFKTSN